MSEAEELKKAQRDVVSGEKERALSILWHLYSSRNPEICLEAGLALLASLDHLTQNEKLLEVVNKSTEIATNLGKNEVRAYLLGKKAQFLFTQLSNTTYQRHNLNLAAGVFQWIDFSLKADKSEFEELGATQQELKKEIAALEDGAMAVVQSSENHYLRGHIFMSLSEISFSRFLHDQLDFYNGGKFRSKILNMYSIRRWHLDKWIGYKRSERQSLREAQKKAFLYLEKAIKEFGAGDRKSDLAHTLYTFAGKLVLTYHFHKGRKYLNQAKQLAKAENETGLFAPISELERQIKDKYRHPRNYVEEFGLDLPRGLRD